MSKTEQDIVEADRQRRTALLAADRPALERLLADEFRYVHASGKVEFRQDYLASVASGSSKFIAIEVDDTLIHAYGDVAVMAGRVQLKRSDAGEVLSKEHQFTAVWVNKSGAWKLTSFQNSSKSKA
jgi:ketosteroid isomerase-like protein